MCESELMYLLVLCLNCLSNFRVCYNSFEMDIYKLPAGPYGPKHTFFRVLQSVAWQNYSVASPAVRLWNHLLKFSLFSQYSPPLHLSTSQNYHTILALLLVFAWERPRVVFRSGLRWFQRASKGSSHDTSWHCS